MPPVMALHALNTTPASASDDENQPPDCEAELAQWLASLQMEHYLAAFTNAGLDLGVVTYVCTPRTPAPCQSPGGLRRTTCGSSGCRSATASGSCTPSRRSALLHTVHRRGGACTPPCWLHPLHAAYVITGGTRNPISPAKPSKRLRQTLLSFVPRAAGGGSLTLQPGRDPPTGTPSRQPPHQQSAPPLQPASAQARRAALLASDDTVRGKAARVVAAPGRARAPPQARATPKRVPFEDLPPWQAVLRAPRMVVDRFGIDYVHCGAAHWFLTHFHADHYKGLSKHFDGGASCAHGDQSRINIPHGLCMLAHTM